jgi:hypothetical protein
MLNIKELGHIYTDHDYVQQEILEAKKLYQRNKWPIIDVTRKSVEEIAYDIASSSNSSADIEGLFVFLKENFLEKGFFETDLSIKKRPNASFLFFKFAIIRNKLINRIASSWINWIFEKRFFYYSFAFIFLSNIFLSVWRCFLM